MCHSAIGDFQILRSVGRGSYGEIFQATGPAGPVALKLLRPDRRTPQMMARFEAEAAALEKVGQHPHVVRLLSPVQRAEEGTLYFAMEFVAGGTLAARQVHSVAETLRVGAGIALALSAIHEAGLLHRDISPSNILMDEEGRPKVGDFGLCAPGEGPAGNTPEFWFAHGDPEFAAPERLFHIESGEAGDAYSLGAILYQMATRRSLFRLSQLSFLYSTYTRQMEQFFQTCISNHLPCPRIDFRPVYHHYLERAPEISLSPSDGPFPPEFTKILEDLLEPDYWKRLSHSGSLAEVGASLLNLAGGER